MIDFIVLNKPFQTLSQFTTSDGKHTLAGLNLPAHFYTAGRLDWDSEGLLILTDNGQFQARLANPKFHLPKTYWVQVEGCPNDAALASLQTGVSLKMGLTRLAKASIMPAVPPLWPRNPPIRQRNNQPTSWLKIVLTEGKNRQVRRMTAAVGHPTLRLIRASIGDWALDDLSPGSWRWERVALPRSSSSQGKPRSANRRYRRDKRPTKS